MMKKTWLVWAILLLFTSLSARSEAIKDGIWRFEMKMAKTNVPFLIEFNHQNKKLMGKLRNGKETILLNDIIVKDKSLSIPLGAYEVSLELNEHSSTLLQGDLVKHNKNPKVEIPVVGVFGPQDRFAAELKKPTIDLAGKWAVTLTDIPEEKSYPGVVVFEQKGNNLSGSILAPTGDYRYLEGIVSGDSFEAASFDGVYNYSVKGTIENGKLKASILTNLETKIEGFKDENAKLPDAYTQTQLESLKFAFPDLKGGMVSLESKEYKNKPVIVQFFGSWCPNCLDEMEYFIPWYKKNKERGVEIIALSFERSLDEAEAKKQLHKIQKKFNVPYPILIAGVTAQDKPMEKIPGLKNFTAFPTTVFLNRKHEVVKVHAGFTGPSTGEFFEKWKVEFNNTVNEILKK